MIVARRERRGPLPFVCAVVGLWMACGATTRHVGVPRIVSELSRPDGRLTISFRYCDEPGTAPQILRLQVYDPDSADSAPAACTLVPRDGVARALEGTWTYGTTPAGFELRGCAPLEPDRTYVVEVMGSGTGARRFRLTPDGQVQTQASACL